MGISSAVNKIAWGKDGTRIASGDSDGVVSIYSL